VIMKISFKHIVCCLIISVGARTLHAEDAMYWEGSFGQISLGNLSTQADVKTASASVVLFTTGDCEISGNRTIAAKLSGPGGDSLITEYKLEFDGNGSGNTGAATVDFTAYDTFTSSPVIITHVFSDDEVSITLSVRASNYPNNVANAGSYSASQTLTVSWAGL
jgi:hypothetical protein